MARISGINVPNHQHAEIALTAIYGIGRARAQSILSAAGVQHSGETAHMSRDAILSIIQGQNPAQSTADILQRLPSKVKPDGAAAYVDIQVWHDPKAKDQLRNYCEEKVFPDMGVLDKAVGIFGDLSKFISKDYAPPHGAEAF